MANEWTFLQIEGPESDRKRLVLAEWNAPFGRSRKEPILKEVIKSRIHTTRYPGGTGQTRHAFGTNWESFELKGRWMTKVSAEPANAIADQWIDFLRDERTIRISWGNIISWTGYLEELELGRESEHDIAWKMRLQIDSQDDKQKSIEFRQLADIDVDVQFFGAWVRFGELIKPIEEDLSPDFLDSLENLAAELNKPQAIMNKLANKFDKAVERTFGALKAMRNAVAGMRTAVVQFRETLLGISVEAAMLVRTAKNDAIWAKSVAEFDAVTVLVMERLADLDRKLEIQEKLEFTKLIIAKDGDTWESLSTRATGSPDGAGQIRSLNGARYGEKPLVGTSYLVP